MNQTDPFSLPCTCDRSHALIPSSLVPYSQIPLEDQVSPIEAFEEGWVPEAVLDSNPEIDDRTPLRLIRMYLIYWRKRFLSKQIALRSLVQLTKQYLTFRKTVHADKKDSEYIFPRQQPRKKGKTLKWIFP